MTEPSFSNPRSIEIRMYEDRYGNHCIKITNGVITREKTIVYNERNGSEFRHVDFATSAEPGLRHLLEDFEAEVRRDPK